MHDTCSMEMVLNWKYESLCIVFGSWKIHTRSQLLLSCAMIFAISYLYEYLKYYITRWNSQNDLQTRQIRVRRSLWYALQVAVSIFLMLVYMTYNGFIITSVILGAAVGHFHWGQERGSQTFALCH